MLSRRPVLVMVAGVAAVCAAAPLAASAASSGAVPAAGPAVPAASLWGRAVVVPGLEVLNRGQLAQVSSVSCASAGNCAAGGFYRDHGQEGFVVSERNGRWGQAIQIPGLAALNQGRGAEVYWVSCGAANSCVAGGDYTGSRDEQQGFVDTERNGRWGQAIEVPGLGALNKGGSADVYSVSCASAGNCLIGGSYTAHGQHAFLAAEQNGQWGQAVVVPGLAAVNTGDYANVESVSCPSAGNCAVGGFYRDGRGGREGFVVSERTGQWGKVVEVPGLAALNKGGQARVYSVSCGSPGNCAAGGYYTDGSIEGDQQAFVTAEQGGRWGRAVEVSGLAKGNYYTVVASVACTRTGPCVAGGYADGNTQQGFVVSEKNGRWGPVIRVLAPKAPANSAAIFSVSCASPGNCAAGGDYQDKDFYNHGMVVAEKNGRWAQGIKVPGLAALTFGQDAGFVNSVSCPTRGTCAAGGAYPRGPRQQAFVTQNGRA
jgi:hypothetical protein